MNCKREDLLLYGVTDRSRLHGKTLYSQVEGALKGGVTFLQLREKELDEAHFRQEAAEIRDLCKKYHVPFIVNDNVEIALEIDADGVHVGQNDMETGAVREKLGPDRIIGVSARTVEQAVLAEQRGADYLGVGAVFPTGTKPDASGVGFEALQEICRTVSIPVVAIGGITGDKIDALKGSGIAGIAVVSAIFAEEDTEKAAKELKEKIREIAGK